MNLQDLNTDPLEATEVMTYLRVHPETVVEPGKESRLRDIVNYFSGATDKGYVINKLISGKPGLDAIDHVWGYVSTRSQYEAKQKELNTLRDELALYER